MDGLLCHHQGAREEMSEKLVFELQAIDRATAPLKAVRAQVSRTAAQINGATASMRGFAQGSILANTATRKWAMGSLQQAGFQVGDFAVQLANGTNGLQAFGQQAPQLLQVFGPLGAVIGAAVAVIAALGVVAQKSGKDLSGLGSALGVLEQPLTAIGSSIKAIGASIGSVFGDLSGEIDTAIIALGLFAAVTALKAVPAMFAASGASALFATSMVTFRAALVASAISAGGFTTAITVAQAAVVTLGAAVRAVSILLMRFLPIVLLVGLAKLVEIFLRLQKGAGGFGEAMKLLGDLVRAVFKGMIESANALPSAMSGVFRLIEAAFIERLASMTGAYRDFLQSFADAADSVGFDFLSSGLEGSMAIVQKFQDKMNSAAADARGNAASSFAESGSIASSSFADAATAAAALKAAIAAGTEEVNVFGDASVSAGEKASGAMEELSQQQENMKTIASSIRDSLSDAFMAMVDGTKSVKAAFSDMARSIISKLYEVLVVQRLVNSIMGFIGGVFPALAPAAAGASVAGRAAAGGNIPMVGGRSSDIMVPSRNPQQTQGKQMGGVVVNQNISFGAGVSRAEIQAMLPKIVESTKAAVFDAQRRSVNGMGY
jgi:hypothetical protein